VALRALQPAEAVIRGAFAEREPRGFAEVDQAEAARRHRVRVAQHGAELREVAERRAQPLVDPLVAFGLPGALVDDRRRARSGFLLEELERARLASRGGRGRRRGRTGLRRRLERRFPLQPLLLLRLLTLQLLPLEDLRELVEVRDQALARLFVLRGRAARGRWSATLVGGERDRAEGAGKARVAQVVRQVAGALVSLRRLFGERAVDDAVEDRGQLAIDLRHRPVPLAGDAVQERPDIGVAR